jgi:predicted RNA-binding Zn ribbon-like protein
MAIEPIQNLSLIGGTLSLDFVNTAGSHLSDHPSEWLHTYRDLVIWAGRAGALSEDEATGLLTWSDEQPEQAKGALIRARTLREVIFHLLLSAMRGEAPDEPGLNTFNQLLAVAPTRLGIVPDGARYAWQFSPEIDSLDAVLWRVLWSAADLLTSGQLAQLKMCEDQECGWLFLDTSRNQSRRWCSMADCGNRAKANRYYKRHKGG